MDDRKLNFEENNSTAKICFGLALLPPLVKAKFQHKILEKHLNKK